jgi:magnesium-transporting ATPase (P-type)
MDELELLKKDWQTNPKQDEARLSGKEIYPMMHKKSSSIVKTLFYISIAELLFWVLINSIPYFSSEEYRADLAAMYGNEGVLLGITIFSYAVILGFVYLLYKSYKSISVTDNAKRLMESIIKTRKIIKYYVIYNLVMAFLSISFGFYYTVYENPEVSQQFAKFSDKQMFITMVVIVLVVAIFVLLFWIFYRIIYGILLRRLKRNYKELKKLEV